MQNQLRHNHITKLKLSATENKFDMRFDHNAGYLARKISSGEFQVTTLKESTNKHICNKYKEFYLIPKYLPTIEPTNL